MSFRHRETLHRWKLVRAGRVRDLECAYVLITTDYLFREETKKNVQQLEAKLSLSLSLKKPFQLVSIETLALISHEYRTRMGLSFSGLKKVIGAQP